MSDPTLFSRSAEPLAARMRPTRLEEFLGQEHLLGPGKALGELIRRGDVGSCIFWGPPGSGKTTLARLIANHTDRHFEPFSAVTEGVARVREIIKQAEERLKYEGRGTILFCDEIHRFNRAQQDAFLPWVENGVITLIGATTENPSFELTAPLLSRCRVFVFEPLKDEHIRAVIERAVEKTGNGKRETGSVLAADGIDALVAYAQGDARRALNGLEAVLDHVTHVSRVPFPVSREAVLSVLERPLPAYDKSGEQHFNPSPPCTRRCVGRTWRGRSIGWRGCSRGARIRCMSPAAWCASPPRTWGWRIRAPCPSRSRPRTPTISSARPRESSRSPRRSCISRARPSRTVCTSRSTGRWTRRGNIRPRRCRCTSAMRRPSSWRTWATGRGISTPTPSRTPMCRKSTCRRCCEARNGMSRATWATKRLSPSGWSSGGM